MFKTISIIVSIIISRSNYFHNSSMSSGKTQLLVTVTHSSQIKLFLFIIFFWFDMQVKYNYGVSVSNDLVHVLIIFIYSSHSFIITKNCSGS